MLEAGGGDVNAFCSDFIVNGRLTVSGQVEINGAALFWTPPQTTAADQPLVYSTGNLQLYRKTNGANYSGPVSNITVQGGIVTGVS